MLVELSWAELLHAATGGTLRTISARRIGRELEQGRSDLGFGRDAEGAIAEMAVAKWLGTYWNPHVGILDGGIGDVAGVQVKSTTRHDGSLIVRPPDPPAFLYVLALLHPILAGDPHVELAGAMFGDIAKSPAYWRDRNPAAGIHRAAYFVPQTDLASVELELGHLREGAIT